MPSNTTYNPTNTGDLEKSKLNFDGQGVTQTITAGQTQNVDLTLTNDCLITGAWLIINNGNFGDSCNFQVVDTTGIYAPAGTVLSQFITNWYLPTTIDDQFDIPYPAKIYSGLTIRLVYTSTGSTNVSVIINYKLHKVLV